VITWQLSFNLKQRWQAQMTLQKMAAGEQSGFATAVVDEAGAPSFVSSGEK